MPKLRRGTWMVLLIGLSLAGCDDPPSGPKDLPDSSVPDSSTPDAGPPSVVAVSCSGITPATDITWDYGTPLVDVTVSAGDVVQWHVTSTTIPHTVTSGTPPTSDGKFSTSITNTSPKCFRFDVVGDYPFFCMIHNSMRGVVHVQ